LALNCAGASGSGYEWYPAFGLEQPLRHTGITFAAGTVKLQAKGGTKVVCKSLSGAGQLTGDQTLVLGPLTLSSCIDEQTATGCQGSGAGQGVIQTTGVDGLLGAAATKTSPSAGVEISPAGGEALAEFACGSVALSVRGSVIFEVKEDAMKAAMSLKAAESKGIQSITHLTGGPERVLQMKVGSSGYEPAGLAAGVTQRNEEKLEVNGHI
jgi:hypothetical protein